MRWESDEDIISESKTYSSINDFIKLELKDYKNVECSFIQDGNVILIFSEDRVIKMHYHVMNEYYYNYNISLPNGVCECTSFEYIGKLIQENGLISIIRPSFRTFPVNISNEYRVCVEMERFGISLYDWMCFVPEKDMVHSPDFDIDIPDSILVKGGMNSILSQPDVNKESIDLINSFIKGVIFQVVGGVSQLYRHTRFVHGDLHCRQVLFLRRGAGSIYSNRNYTLNNEKFTLIRERYPSVCIIDLEHCTYIKDNVEYSGHVDGYCNTVDGSYDLYRFCSSLMYHSCITMKHVWHRIYPETREFLLEHSKVPEELCGRYLHPVTPPPQWALFTPNMMNCMNCDMVMTSKIFDVFRGSSNICNINCIENQSVPRDISWINTCEMYLGKRTFSIPDYQTMIKGLYSTVHVDLSDESCDHIDCIIREISNKTIRFIENTLAHVYTGSSLEFTFVYMWLEMVRTQQAIKLLIEHIKISNMKVFNHHDIRTLGHIFQGYVRHRWINNSWDSVAIKNFANNTCTYTSSQPSVDITREEMNLCINVIKKTKSFHAYKYMEYATPIHTCCFMNYDKTRDDINVKIQELRNSFINQMNINAFLVH